MSDAGATGGCDVNEFKHSPVMLAEVIEALCPRDGGRYVDATLGGGGHARAILEASAPGGWLYGCDRDADAVEAARQRLGAFAGRFELRHGNFEEMAGWVPAASCDGVLMDLGVSSPQIDRVERGFSFMRDGPLDMRMDRRQALTAAQLVNEASAAELARWFWELGDERESRRIARAIERERATRRIATTGELAALIERVAPRRGQKSHPATRVFMALRMVVNDELGFLERGLSAALGVLKPGGRLAVITFHSVEDRFVKNFGRETARDYCVPGTVDVPELRRSRSPLARWVSRKAILPREPELAANPRARSAQLRVLERL
jgi:16S rRNA (cytosine1402-N4)-methyltransferase